MCFLVHRTGQLGAPLGPDIPAVSPLQASSSHSSLSIKEAWLVCTISQGTVLSCVKPCLVSLFRGILK